MDWVNDLEENLQDAREAITFAQSPEVDDETSLAMYENAVELLSWSVSQLTKVLLEDGEIIVDAS